MRGQYVVGVAAFPKIKSARKWKRIILREQAEKKFSALEIRADAFEGNLDSLLENIAIIKRKTEVPIILTVRKMSEGGNLGVMYQNENETRLKRYSLLIDQADWVDTEVYGNQIRDKVIELARKKGKKIILSYHDNFISKKNPSRVLTETVLDIKSFGIDSAKVVVTTKNEEECLDFLETGKKLQEIMPVTFLASGRHERQMRFSNLIYNSFSTYLPIGNPEINPFFSQELFGEDILSLVRYTTEQTT